MPCNSHSNLHVLTQINFFWNSKNTSNIMIMFVNLQNFTKHFNINKVTKNSVKNKR